jgi:hypothetical protein
MVENALEISPGLHDAVPFCHLTLFFSRKRRAPDVFLPLRKAAKVNVERVGAAILMVRIIPIAVIRLGIKS